MSEIIAGLLDRLLTAAVKFGVLVCTVAVVAAAGFATNIIPRNLLGGQAYEWTIAALFVGLGLLIAGCILQIPSLSARIVSAHKKRRWRNERVRQIVGNVRLLSLDQKILLAWLLQKPEQRFNHLRGDSIAALQKHGILALEHYETEWSRHESGAMVVADPIWMRRESILATLLAEMKSEFPMVSVSADEIERAAKEVLQSDQRRLSSLW